MDPVPDPVLLRKPASAGNRNRDLWICSQELWPLDHRGGPSSIKGVIILFIYLFMVYLTDYREFRMWGWWTENYTEATNHDPLWSTCKYLPGEVRKTTINFRHDTRSLGPYLNIGLAEHVAGMEGNSVRYSVGYSEQVSSLPGHMYPLCIAELLNSVKHKVRWHTFHPWMCEGFQRRRDDWYERALQCAACVLCTVKWG
jgi:hypothetical protein